MDPIDMPVVRLSPDAAERVAKAEKVLSAVVITTASVTIQERAWMEFKDAPGFRDSHKHQLAAIVSEELLKRGLLLFTERNTEGRDGWSERVIEAELVALNPKLDNTSKAALADAERAGMMKAMAMVRESANRLRALDMYGPVQALALDGAADRIKEAAYAP